MESLPSSSNLLGMHSLQTSLLTAPGVQERSGNDSGNLERVSPRAWPGYAVAVGGTILAAVLRWELGQLFGERFPHFLSFYPVAMVSALLGGCYAGVLATLLSAGAVDFLFLRPFGFGVQRPVDTEALLAFIVLNLLISYGAGKLREARLRDRQRVKDLAFTNEELERRVAERTAQLTHTVGELEHFSHAIIHDMRAPLRALSGYSSLLLKECPELLGANHLDLLRRIGESARRMDLLILDSLDYSKILLEKMRVAPVEIEPLLEGLIETYPALHAPHAQIRIEGPIPRVIANQAGLVQCCSNLLDNAVKFVAPGQSPQVRVWAETRGEWVRLWFEDNGKGIPPEYHERIFDMFQRLDRQCGSTGIGLALVRKIIERMGGKTGVESEPGKGSRFWVELKRAP